MNVSITRVQHVWAGAGTTAAPDPSGMANFTVGVNQGGVTAADVYWVINGAWVDTGASVANLFGA